MTVYHMTHLLTRPQDSDVLKLTLKDCRPWEGPRLEQEKVWGGRSIREELLWAAPCSHPTTPPIPVVVSWPVKFNPSHRGTKDFSKHSRILPTSRFEGVVRPWPYHTLTLILQQLDFYSKEVTYSIHTRAVMQFKRMLIWMTIRLDPRGKHALKSKSGHNLKLLSTLLPDKTF